MRPQSKEDEGDGSHANNGFDDTTQISEIETKFMKKKELALKKINRKIYKEDSEEMRSNYLEDQFKSHGKEGRIEPILKTNKQDLRQLEEFISTKRPRDPFKDLDPLVSKVDITVGVLYEGTSKNDVF